jgi:hypothetical protein
MRPKFVPNGPQTLASEWSQRRIRRGVAFVIDPWPPRSHQSHQHDIDHAVHDHRHRRGHVNFGARPSGRGFAQLGDLIKRGTNDDQNDRREIGRKIPTALPEPPTATMRSPEPLRTNAASAQQHACGRPIFRSTVVRCHPDTVHCQPYRRCGAVLRRACAVCVSSVVRRHAQCWRDKSEPKRISLQLQGDESRAPVNNGASTWKFPNVVTPFRQKLAIPLLPLFRKSRPSNITRDGDHLVVFNAVSSPPSA